MAKCGSFEVEVGFQVYLQDGGEEIGAVRDVAPDQILDPTKVAPELLTAARAAHSRETD